MIKSEPGSFRDPSGFLFFRDGILYRQINRSFREEFEHFVSSGLYRKLVDSGVVIPYEDLETFNAASEDAYKVIRPDVVDFVSYPYEWSFGMLKDAALLTLRIQKEALDHGMSLRDASAYNILFHRGRPIHIDSLSFERHVEGKPWVAYRQFCQHFLAPLALMSKRDIRLGQLMRIHIDGIPLDLAAGLLPRRPLSLGLHIHAHARSQKRHEGSSDAKPRSEREFSMRAFRGLVDSLESAVGSLDWAPEGTAWVDYYKGDSYEEPAMQHKRELVGKFLEEAAPKTVWDLGGNVGEFARIAASRGAFTACFDFDPGCVEANYRKVVSEGEKNVLPLVLDLTNPSASIGWEGRERMSLVERGPADVALALALVHHLVIGNNVPIARVGAFFASVCRRLLVEFVPKSDPKVKVLLSTREDIFHDYTKEGFERGMAEHFDTVRAEPIHSSDRVLYLMRRKDY